MRTTYFPAECVVESGPPLPDQACSWILVSAAWADVESPEPVRTATQAAPITASLFGALLYFLATSCVPSMI